MQVAGLTDTSVGLPEQPATACSQPSHPACVAIEVHLFNEMAVRGLPCLNALAQVAAEHLVVGVPECCGVSYQTEHRASVWSKPDSLRQAAGGWYGIRQRRILQMDEAVMDCADVLNTHTQA